MNKDLSRSIITQIWWIAAAMLVLSAFVSASAFAQSRAPAPPKPPRAMSEQEVRDFLVWNSPWESRTATPGQIYSYRTVFVVRRNELIAEVMRYSNNERGDSVVSVKEGRVLWQDSSGGNVTVALDDIGELVGVAATSPTTAVNVVFKPRP